jgi:hypothetical protein
MSERYQGNHQCPQKTVLTYSTNSLFVAQGFPTEGFFFPKFPNFRLKNPKIPGLDGD